MIERAVILDTNVIISALLIKQSVARQAFDKAFQQHKILLSLPTLEELNSVLKRKKFNKYILENERLQFLAVLARKAHFIEINETIAACRDPKDNKFLELAVSGEADCIVSGDKDLLILHPFRGISIIPPAEFLRLF